MIAQYLEDYNLEGMKLVFRAAQFVATGQKIYEFQLEFVHSFTMALMLNKGLNQEGLEDHIKED